MVVNQCITPASGAYNGWHKGHARKKQLTLLLSGRDPATTKIVILPSNDWREVPLLLSMGVLEHNIYAVDMRKAPLCNANSKKYLSVNRIHADLGDAFIELAKRGVVIDALNADVCGTWCKGTNEMLRKIADSGVLAPGAGVSITQSVGHIDPKQMKKRDPKYKDLVGLADDNRALYAAYVMEGSAANIMDIDEYRNKGRGPTMQWVAFNTRK